MCAMGVKKRVRKEEQQEEMKMLINSQFVSILYCNIVVFFSSLC